MQQISKKFSISPKSSNKPKLKTCLHAIRFPKAIEELCSKFCEKGYEIYAVGGAVRDIIIHLHERTTNRTHIQNSSSLSTLDISQLYDDVDFATSATPTQVMDMFPHTIATGLQHGTVTVLHKKIPYEITTYRIESNYSDHRAPDSVAFASSIKEDLSRRDFSINAIAINPLDATVIDLFDGCADIERKLIRCVGDAQTRYKEDALRMLRAIRFATKLDFNISQESYDAISLLAPTLQYISKERICTEFRKTICSSNPSRGIHLLYSTNLLAQVFEKKISKYESSTIVSILSGENVATHHARTSTETMPKQDILSSSAPSQSVLSMPLAFQKSVKLNSTEETLRLAVCTGYPIYTCKNSSLHLSLPKITESYRHAQEALRILKLLRFSNTNVQEIIFIIERIHYIKEKNQQLYIRISDFKLSWLISKYGQKNTLLLLKYLQIYATHINDFVHSTPTPDTSNPHMTQPRILEELARLTTLAEDKNFLVQSIHPHQLSIKGNELVLLLERSPGPWLRTLMNTLHRHVLQHPQDNNAEALRRLATTRYHLSEEKS